LRIVRVIGGKTKISGQAKRAYAVDVEQAARFDELLASARAAENEFRKAQSAAAPNNELYLLARKFDAALTDVMQAAYAAERAEIGPRGYDDKIYRRKAKAKPGVHAWTDLAERLLTLRETHRITGIPPAPRDVPYVPPPRPDQSQSNGLDQIESIKMSNWIQAPELDDSARVGLSFIAIGYGVVLVAVFPLTPLAQIGVAGWFHLGLAAFMLIVSYMGYYSNRAKYTAWRVKFFNFPLLQYIISFGILFMYWELGVTRPRGSRATPVSEAIIVLVVFTAYLAWDFLEVAVQESVKYNQKLLDAGKYDKLKYDKLKYDKLKYDKLPPLAENYTRRPGRRMVKARTRWFAKDARTDRAVTFLFTCLSALGLALIVSYHSQGTTAIVIVDSIYIIGLFAYRYCQWKWSNFWYRREPRADLPDRRHHE
jgi:hypothetical protein